MEQFVNILDSLYCDCFPLKFKYLSAKRLKKPWITSSILKSIKTKSLYFKLQKAGLITTEFNNRYRNILTSVIRNSRNIYYQNLFLKNRNNLSKTWEVIRGLVNRKDRRSTVRELTIGGIGETDGSKIAEELNSFFTNVGSQIHNSLPDVSEAQMSYSNVSSFFLSPVTPSEIKTFIMSLKNTKTEQNCVPVSILKQCSDILCVPLSILINKSFCTGVFPQILKKARITPIFKSGDPCMVGNYRPISVLHPLSKVFERSFLVRFSGFIDENRLISHNQFGFVKGKNTQDALIKFTETMYENLNNRKVSAAIYLDLRKAFDCVHHGTLLHKLKSYGFRGVSHQWIKSYLSNRNQYVKIDHFKSESQIISTGVPQGSLIGPALFILFINDLSDISEEIDILLYADDTTILLSDSEYENVVFKGNSNLLKIDNWLKCNRLALNVDKSSWMLYTNRHIDTSDSHSHMNIDNLPLKFCANTKSLGVTFDSNLNFKSHIENIVGKISKTVGVFYKIKSLVPNQVLISLYYSLVYPYLIYCVLIWGGTFRSYLDKILLLQKKIVRIITNSEYLAHSDPLFHRTGILKIQEIYDYQLSIFAYKNQNNFTSFTHEYQTRFRDIAVPTFQRLSISQRSLSYAAPSMFNSLPNEVKNSRSLPMFKKKCKTYLLDRYLVQD